MTRTQLLASLVAVGSWATGAATENSSMAVRPETFLSSDADGNETWKSSLGWDWSHRDREHWMGVDIQYARFSGEGWSHEEQRVYGRAAGTIGQGEVRDDTWRWQARLGTNGHTVLGNVTLNTDGPHRREVFLERELLDTQAGVERRQMYNLVGAALDQPIGTRLSGTAVAALQTFGDDNERIHLRGNLVWSVVPQQGLSLQARSRYFHNSEPYLGGYYSPPWYAEALAVVGVRRVMHGYAWRVLAGLGRQRNAEEEWKRARLLEASLESPRWKQNAGLRLIAGYTDTPVATSSGMGNYSYRYAMLEAFVTF